ncbi:placenta-specific gene 8 [Paramuricea clavata]|nr:placenta-specific gene 8 [Paramuricea clavata]
MASIEPVTEQPEPVIEQPEEAVVDVAPPTEGVPPSASGAWSSGLCGCCGDMGSCCLGTFCTPILAFTLSSKMNECCCAGCIGAASLRTKHRIQHKIQGSVCTDNLLSCIFLPCALCQLARDLKTR